MIKVHTNMDDVDWVEFKLLQQDAPNMLSTYVMRNYERKVGEKFHIRHIRWARLHRRTVKKLTRRLELIVQKINIAELKQIKEKKAMSPKQKKGRNGRIHIGMKYGVVLPRNTKEALELDVITGTTSWCDAIKKEID